MFKYTNAFTNRSGDSLPGYFAKLFDSDGYQVDLFADNGGTPISTISGVANAALSDENGMFRWYVANGTYDIRFYDSNDVFKSVEVGVPMIDASGVYTDLSADDGATRVGTPTGTVQDDIDARPTASALAADDGAELLGTEYGTAAAIIQRGVERTPMDFGATGSSLADATTALADWANSGEKLAMPSGDYTFVTEAPIELSVAGTRITGGGQSKIALGQRNAGRGMIELIGDNCFIDGLTLTNPDLLKSETGEQAFAVLSRCNGGTMQGLRVYDFEMGLATSAGQMVEGEFYDTRYIGNFIRVLGCGPGTPDDASGDGEDRGDGITHWGGRGIASGNIIVPKGGTDCRIGIFFEALNAFAADTSGIDNAANGIVIGNIIGAADVQTNGGGRFRRGIDIENYARAVVSSNTVRSTAWHGIQLAGKSDLTIVANNSIYYDLPAGNANGASSSPVRAGIHIYPNGETVESLKIIGNNIYNTDTDTVTGIFARGLSTSVVKNMVISDNTVVSAADTAGIGIVALDFAAGSHVEIARNRVAGDWNDAIAVNNVPQVSIEDNNTDGNDDLSLDLQTITKAHVRGNIFRNADTGIQTVSVATLILDNNLFDTMATRCIVNSGTTAIYAKGNVCREGGGLVGDFGTLTTPRWAENSGFAYLTGTSTYDPASVAANAIGGASGNITVTGALAGDRVKASFSLVTQGLVPMAAVSATNTVIASFANPTGSAVDLASGTVTVSVERG